jgi:uncharacterized repeat protein (TIGR01451 family)
MKTRQWFVAMLVIAVMVSFGAGAASAQGGTGGGGGGTGGGGTTTATPSADLQLSGSASTNSPSPGSAYSYTFQVKNSGSSSASSVVFTDPVPVGTSPNFVTLGGSTLPCAAFGDGANGTNLVCDIGTLAKGQSATVVVNLNAPQTAASITNTATVQSSTPDPQPTNNSVTVNVAVKAPTGGVCKGGVCDTVPAPVGTPCAVLTSVSAPVGYYLSFAAIWNTFTVQSCSTGSEAVSLQVTETNVATGSIDYDITYPLSLAPSQNLGLVLDNDFAPFNTTYDITYTVRDLSGVVLSAASTTATTPAPR